MTPQLQRIVDQEIAAAMSNFWAIVANEKDSQLRGILAAGRDLVEQAVRQHVEQRLAELEVSHMKREGCWFQ